MKILHVLGSLHFSGQEMMMACCHTSMKKEKIRSYIVSTGHKIGPAYKLLKSKGYKIKHIMFNKNKAFRSLIRLLGFFSLLNYLLKNKFDIIHIHTEANFFKISICAILSGHRKIIRTVHNVFFPNFILRFRRRLILKFCEFLKVKYTSTSDIVAKNEFKNYNIKVTPQHIWYDESKFFFINKSRKKKLRSKFKISVNTLVFLSVGNCSTIKNHNLILKTLSILPKNLDWIYYHVGNEDKDKSERKLAKELNIEKKCKFLGAKHNYTNFAHLSDIFIMPSLVEGLGVATIEASAIGLIPILTKVPGNNEILKKIKGSIGIKKNSLSLKKAILKINRLKQKQKNKISFFIHQQVKKTWSKKNIYTTINYYKDI